MTEPASGLTTLQGALRIALKTSILPSHPAHDDANNIHAASGESNHRDPERFRRLFDALYFSRDLIKTYNAALILILAVLSAIHWTRVLKRRSSSRLNDSFLDEAKEGEVLPLDVDGQIVGEASSSGSSTVGDAPYPLEDDQTHGERKPLLRRRQTSARGVKTGGITCAIRAWMMYQPANLPIIHKVFPSNATSLVILAFLGFNMFYTFYRLPIEWDMLFIFADRVGLVFVANLPVLYLLGAKNQPICWLTGHSYESLNIFHRRLGELLSSYALLHVGGMTIVWYQELRPRGQSFWDYVSHPLIYFGLLAFSSYEILYLTSLGSFRQRCYELFLGLHIILQALGLGFLFFHFPQTRPYVVVSLAIFLIDRFLFRLILKTATVSASLTILPDDKTLLVSANWDIDSHRFSQRPSVLDGWRPTDHVFLSIPALGRTHALQAHPFTICSAAPNPGSHAWLSFLIRAHDGFSSDLLDYARSHRSVSMRVDGPYGSSHALHTLQDTSTAIFVAGGSGIAVAYPLLYALLCPDSSGLQPSCHNSIVSDTEQGLLSHQSAPGHARDSRRVRLLWVIHSRSHLSWLPSDKLEELVSWGLEVHIPSPTAEAGRPDVKSILRPWIPKSRGRSSVGVVVSGPNALTRDVRNLCASEAGKGAKVSVCVEKFGW